MKCPYCGGEVSSQSVACPFCGRENAEGIAFQQEVSQKIERNKLLKPFLKKQKTPELVQRMLNRILLILIMVNVILIAFSCGLITWSAREVVRNPISGSYAETYLQEYHADMDDYYFKNFYRSMSDFMEAYDSGEAPDRDKLINLVNDGRRALKENCEDPSYEGVYTFEVAFFRGFLGLSEAECEFLEPGEDGEYDYLTSDDEKIVRAVDAIEKKYEEGKW